MAKTSVSNKPTRVKLDKILNISSGNLNLKSGEQIMGPMWIIKNGSSLGPVWPLHNYAAKLDKIKIIILEVSNKFEMHLS
jgi:hypothetical protein